MIVVNMMLFKAHLSQFQKWDQDIIKKCAMKKVKKPTIFKIQH